MYGVDELSTRILPSTTEANPRAPKPKAMPKDLDKADPCIERMNVPTRTLGILRGDVDAPAASLPRD